MDNGLVSTEQNPGAPKDYSRENMEVIDLLDKLYLAKTVDENGETILKQKEKENGDEGNSVDVEAESEDDDPILDGLQFVVPGDFSLDPAQKFTFRGPYDTKQAKMLKIVNKSTTSKIAFKIEVFSQGRIELSNTIGLIEPGGCSKVEVRTMRLKSVPNQKDRIQVDVMNAPDGKLEASWFWKDGMRTRRSVSVKYLK